MTASFTYDAVGRRQSKVVNGTTTQFLYDGLTPVQELSGAGVTANLLTGLGIDEYFTRTTTAGTRTLLTDALGSTVALTDDAGALQNEYTYEPFGTTTETGADSNPFQYTGRENDGTGLYYYRARYYHPGLQRFASEDPAGFRGSKNFYAYVEDSPATAFDPLGLAVTISQYRCCSGATHLGIGVDVWSPLDTVGFYSKNGLGWGPGIVVPDASQKTLGDLIDSITLATTPEEDRKVLDVINQWKAKPPSYIFGLRDCGSFVQAALQAAGIDPIGREVGLPWSVFGAIKRSPLVVTLPPY